MKNKRKLYKLNCVCKTAGNGLWSRCERNVEIYGLSVSYIDDEFQLIDFEAHFKVKSWDVEKYGLIYTDKGWIREFRKIMTDRFGLSKSCSDDIDYTEQGMQGGTYVSLGVGKKSSDELIKKFISFGLISIKYNNPL